jgi:hypothetical protein
VIGRFSDPEGPVLFVALVVARIGDSAATLLATPQEITGIPIGSPSSSRVLSLSNTNRTGTAYVYGVSATFGGEALTDGVNLYVPKPIAGSVPNPLPKSTYNPDPPGSCDLGVMNTTYVEALTVPVSALNKFVAPFPISGLRTLERQLR